jgi:hypothetical protein
VKTSEPLAQKLKVTFHSIIAKFLYLGKQGRPDILLAVQFLCTRVKQPNNDDLLKLERVLGYLHLTKNRTQIIDDSPFEGVETYIDVAFLNHPDGKSQSGCMVFLGNKLVHEACRKQKLVTKSSTEAELVALSDYIIEGEMIEELVMNLGALMKEDLVTNVHLVHQDNMSTITLSTKGGGKPRTKYMRVHQEYIKEHTGTGELQIKYCKTKFMLAIILTKALGGEHFHNIADKILGYLPHPSNRGAKKNMNDQLSRVMESLSCSNTGTTRSEKHVADVRPNLNQQKRSPDRTLNRTL